MNSGLIPTGPTRTGATNSANVPDDVLTSKYLTAPLTGTLNRETGVYLPTVAKTRARRLINFKNGIARAMSGAGVCRVVAAGDSLTYGSYATSSVYAWPHRMGQILEAVTGLPVTYGLVVADTVANEPRWATSGSGVWTISGYTWASTTASSTLTFTSTDAGDRVIVAYWPNVIGAFTVTIDGGAPATVTVGSTAVTQTKWAVYTGLANTTHTVVITVTSGQANIFGAGIERTGGIAITRRGIPGLNSQNGAPTWYHASELIAPFAAGASNSGPGAWDLALHALGTNDQYFQNVHPNATRSNHVTQSTAVTSLSGGLTDLVYLTPIPTGITPVSNGWSEADLNAVIYQAAEITGNALIDIRALWGSYTRQNTAGMYYTDHQHCTDTGYARIGVDAARALLSI